MKTQNKIRLLTAVCMLMAAAAYASAQPKPAPAAPAPAAASCGGKMDCPMMKDGKRIDATASVEKSERGAIVRIQAKNAADTADVQRMAQAIAKHIEEGCPMMGGEHGHGPHGHGGGMHSGGGHKH
jgi:hypothetical protein